MLTSITFPEGRFKALTMSYDDGRTQDRRLVELFNKYGIKGTFHLNSGWMDPELVEMRKEAVSLYEGHEIATHSLTHPTLSRLSDTAVA
ncbi:MAG: polysaccharide deacetylase family protein, partial [Lachnospiraceae bacterium]|nr:polysaccharide deacetylase family protein [Lachnospiraceae bacterium]